MPEEKKTQSQFSNNSQEKIGRPVAQPTEGASTGTASRMAIRPLKTYRGDTEEAIQRQKESIASIALTEQKKRAEEKKFEVPPLIHPENRRRIIIVASVMIGILALGGGTFYLIRTGNFSFPATKPTTTVAVKTNAKTPAIISPRYEREVVVEQDISKNTLAKIVAEETLKAQEAGAITNIFFTQTRSQTLKNPLGKDIVPTGTFINEFFVDAPEILKRSLDNDFMLGVYYDSSQKGHAFFILKTSSFETSFAGMLSWEKTLPQDLGLVIGSKEGVGGFKDIVMRNKDTRALLDRGQAPVLLYSFIDRDTILVAPDKETFGNVIDILNQPKRITQ